MNIEVPHRVSLRSDDEKEKSANNSPGAKTKSTRKGKGTETAAGDAIEKEEKKKRGRPAGAPSPKRKTKGGKTYDSSQITVEGEEKADEAAASSQTSTEGAPVVEHVGIAIASNVETLVEEAEPVASTEATYSVVGPDKDDTPV